MKSLHRHSAHDLPGCLTEVPGVQDTGTQGRKACSDLHPPKGSAERRGWRYISALPPPAPPATRPGTWGALCQHPSLSPGGNFHLAVIFTWLLEHF